MQVQKVRTPAGRQSWLVLGNNFKPIKPIHHFLRYLDNTDKSPFTIQTYAYHLCHYWRYLFEHDHDWATINIDNLAGFVTWLKAYKKADNVISITPTDARCVATINSILGCLTSFYRYHNQLGNTEVSLTESSNKPQSRYKSMMHHVYRHKPAQRRIISLKEFKKVPKTLSEQQYQRLLSASLNMRDLFLVTLLFETGLRIGQALNLQHSDIVTWDNEIHVIPRQDDSPNRNKSYKPNLIHVSKELMALYVRYINACPESTANKYVFINLKTTKPLSYPMAYKIFRRLSKRVGFYVTPHILRHTHATELIKSGMEASFVQQRLGHVNVQTTINTYTHIDQKTLKKAYKSFLANKEAKA